MGKEEIAPYEQFLLFPQRFESPVLQTRKNQGLFGEGLIIIIVFVLNINSLYRLLWQRSHQRFQRFDLKRQDCLHIGIFFYQNFKSNIPRPNSRVLGSRVEFRGIRIRSYFVPLYVFQQRHLCFTREGRLGKTKTRVSTNKKILMHNIKGTLQRWKNITKIIMTTKSSIKYLTDVQS